MSGFRGRRAPRDLRTVSGRDADDGRATARGEAQQLGGNPHAVNGSWEIAKPRLIDRGRLDPTHPAADLLRVHARALSSLLCLCLVCLTCHRLSHDLSTCVRSASLRWRSGNQHDQVSLFPNPRLDLQRYRGAPHHSPCARCRQQLAAEIVGWWCNTSGRVTSALHCARGHEDRLFTM